MNNITINYILFSFFGIIVILSSCNNENKVTETDKDSFEIPDTCYCDDLILDEKYNHYYYYKSKRTDPYTGFCNAVYESGEIQMHKPIIEGKIEGLVTEYYEDGTIKSEFVFNEDHVYDEVKRYFPSGNLKYHAKYKFGQIDTVITNLQTDSTEAQ